MQNVNKRLNTVTKIMQVKNDTQI